MSSLDEFHRKKPVHLWPITLLRVYTGVFFLIYGWGKIRNPEFADGLADRFRFFGVENGRPQGGLPQVRSRGCSPASLGPA